MYLTEKQRLISENAILLNEKAKFGRWFKKYPELEEHKDLVREVEFLLGRDAPGDNKRICRAILNAIAIYDDAIMPLSFLGFPLLPLLNRFDKYLMDVGNHMLAASQTRDIIRELERQKGRSEDKKFKAKCDQLIAKLEDNLSKID